jgi:CrcB protein
MVDQLWLVGFGGCIGAMARYWVNLTFSKNGLFPQGTFLVNISGSFLMGILLGTEWLPLSVSLMVGSGFLGAYTTFSTLNFELFLLKKSKRKFMFVFYSACSYLLGTLVAGMGYWIGTHL